MLHIIDNIYVNADDNNYILVEKTDKIYKSTGEPVYKTLGFYSNLNNALKGYIGYSIKNHIENNDTTLKDTIDIANNLFDRIKNLNIFNNKELENC